MMSLFIILLPLVSLIPFLMSTSQENISTTLLIVLGIMIADNGHVFLTSLRLFHNRRTQHEKILYISVYVFFLFLTYFWFVFQIPYFWSFFLYLTAYHHLRQNLGMGAWISKSSGRLTKLSRFLFYWIFLSPLLLFHLRPDLQNVGIMPGVLEISNLGFILPSTTYKTLMIFNFVIFAILFLFHFYKVKNQKLNFYILSVSILNCVSFLYGSNFYEIYIPLVLCHGLTYYFVMIHSTQKIFSWNRKWAYFIVIGFGVLAGLLDWNLQFDEMYSYHELNVQKLALLGISFSLSINLSHYIIDGWIWKKGDSEYKQIFS